MFGYAGAASAAAVKPTVKPAYNMAIPNGVRPQKAEPIDATMADDSASEADSAGWETASDVDTDSTSAQAPKARPTSGGKNAEAAGRSNPSTSASSSGQQSMDTANTDRVAESSAKGISADEAYSAQQFEEWDVCRSLFDNHVSASMEANLEYMFKYFGFYLPDAEYLSDPAGLIKYLVRQLSSLRAQLTALLMCPEYLSITLHNKTQLLWYLVITTALVSIDSRQSIRLFLHVLCSDCVSQWLCLHCGFNMYIAALSALSGYCDLLMCCHALKSSVTLHFEPSAFMCISFHCRA